MPAERSEGDLESAAAPVLDRLASAGADLGEIFVEDTTITVVRAHDGAVEHVTSGRRRGAGLRVIRNGRQFLAHTSDLSAAGLRSAADRLVGTLPNRRGGSPGAPEAGDTAVMPSAAVEHTHHLGHHHPSRIRCLEIVGTATDAAREGLDRGAVTVDLETGRRHVHILNTDGRHVQDSRVRTEVTVDCALAIGSDRHNGRRNRGESVGADLVSLATIRELGQAAAEQARHAAVAAEAPTGVMDVVVAPGTAGVLFHETVGHGLEADVVERFQSVYRGRLETRVASELLTVTDDGSRPGGWGSALLDDEGTASSPTPLVEAGLLRSYLCDTATAARFGGTPTGNSRRASYQQPPFVRMTNTVVEPGRTDPASIIEDTTAGIYVAHLRGGSFNPGTGDFLFSTAQAYLIERGRVTQPIRNVTIVGSALHALQRVDAVGDDFAMVAGGRCGKRGQSLPVGFGSPTIRIRALTIGGTRA